MIALDSGMLFHGSRPGLSGTFPGVVVNFRDWLCSVLKTPFTPVDPVRRRPRPPKLESLEDRWTPAAGDLDTSFGNGGIVTTEFFRGNNEIRSVTLQTDGKILAVGQDFSLARYNSDGTVDATFGTNGFARPSTLGGSSYSLAIQADGKIVVAGTRYNGTNNDISVMRYTSSGILDLSFDGDGEALTPVGTNSEIGRSVAVQTDGKIVVAGYARMGTYDDIAVVRYNVNGALDTTFDTDGITTTAIGSRTDVSNSVVVQPDGKIVVGGYSDNGSNYDYALVRYTTSGGLDGTFDGDGIVTTAVLGSNETIESIALQADGKILATGFVNNGGKFDVGVVRYDTNGAVDNSFNGDGRVITSASSFDDRPYKVCVQSDQKIVVGVYTPIGGSISTFSLVRLNTNGSLDNSFDGDGKKSTPIEINLESTGVAVQADGKILVGGAQVFDSARNFALARYDSSGALDPSFDADGIVITPIAQSGDVALSVTLQPDGKIVAAGSAGSGFNLARYNTGGTLDASFDGDGRKTVLFPGGGLSPSSSSRAACVQPDGKILVGGQFSDLFFSGTFIRSYDFALARLNADGSLDNTFDGDGKKTISFVGNSSSVAAAFEVLNAIDLQADNKIVVAGQASNGSNADFGVARMNPDGSLDGTFDGDGLALIPIGSAFDGATAVDVQSDGKIMLAGFATNGTFSEIALARLNANGSPDGSFGSGGKVITSIGGATGEIFGLATQSDGKVVVAGRWKNGSFYDVIVLRYNTNGTLDTSFDADGMAITTLGAGDDSGSSIQIAPDGKILVAGSYNNGTNTDFALLRYLPNGALDSVFGGDGIVTTDIGSSGDAANALLLQTDDSIVAAGYATISNSADFAIARYIPGGSLVTVLDGLGNLSITDIADHDNLVDIDVIGSSLVISSNSGDRFDGAPAGWTISGDRKTLTTSLAGFSGAIALNAAGGNDTLTLDFSGGDFGKAITFNGGNPITGSGDKLVLERGSSSGLFNSITHTFTNASDGSVGMGSTTVNYIELEGVTDNLDTVDRFFTFNGGSETISLADASGARMTIDSSLSESITFGNPTGSLTINAGTGDDILALASFDSAFNASLNVHGGTGNDAVNLDAGMTFASGRSLDIDLQNDDAIPGTDYINVAANADFILSGSGSATLKASQHISMAASSSITAVDGSITLESNQQTMPTPGNFVGVNLDGATLSTSGSGVLSLDGRGGSNAAGSQRGILIQGGSSLASTGTGTIIVKGAGGASVGNDNVGLEIIGAGTVISSDAALIQLSGDGGGTGSSAGNTGVRIADIATITATGNSAVTILGNGGGGVSTASNHGVEVVQSQLNGVNGNISVTASGGGGTPDAGSPTFAFSLGTSASIQTTGSGDISMTADSMLLDNTSTVDAGANVVILNHRSNGPTIALGSADSPGILGLTDVELDRISAGTLEIGAVSSGAIYLNSDISRPIATTVNLMSGSSINFSDGSLDTAGGDVTLAPGSFSSFGNAGNDVTAGMLSLNSDSNLNIAIGGTNVDTQYERLMVAGTVDLTGVGLVLTGSYVPGNNEIFTIVSATSRTGIFDNLPQGTPIAFHGKTLAINYTPTSVFLFANEPPDALDGSDTTDEDVALPIDLRLLVSDPETPSASLTYTIKTDPINGTLGATATPGLYTYTPLSNFHGTDTFEFEANDGYLGSNVASFALTIDSVNDVPTFTKGADQAVIEDASSQVVSGWATDISTGPANESSQTLAFLVSTDHDALFSVLPFIDAFGNLTYTPADNANGSATITVELQDSGGGSDTSPPQTFVIDVSPVNDAPDAQPDNVSVKAGKTVTIPVLANDSDVELGTMHVVGVTKPTYGTVRIEGNTLVYTPRSLKGVVDTFDYSVSDGQGGTSVGTVSVTILDVTPPKIQAVRLYYGPNDFIDASAVSHSIMAWDRLYKVAVVFSEEVIVNPNAMTFSRHGLAVPTAFAWDLATRTATWTPVDPIVDGRTTIRLSATGVEDTSGNLLTKDWVRSFGLLAGDFDGNGIVNQADLKAIKKRFTKPKVALARLADVDGNGVVNQADLDRATSNMGQRLK